MNREIIQQIERSIEKTLRQQLIPSQAAAFDKRALAIFDAAQASLELPLQQLEKCIQDGYLIKAILSDLAFKLLDISLIKSVCGTENVLASSEITNLQPFTDDFPVLVIPVLSSFIASKLALGIADTPCTHLILQAILHGNTVIATSNLGQEPGEIESESPILQLGRNYLEKLSHFGIQFLKTEDLAQAICSHESLSIQYGAAGYGTTVISASLIADLAPTVRTLLHEGPSIITPLARDLAKRKGIQVVAKTKSGG